jgi:hypothetical protein
VLEQRNSSTAKAFMEIVKKIEDFLKQEPVLVVPHA